MPAEVAAACTAAGAEVFTVAAPSAPTAVVILAEDTAEATGEAAPTAVAPAPRACAAPLPVSAAPMLLVPGPGKVTVLATLPRDGINSHPAAAEVPPAPGALTPPVVPVRLPDPVPISPRTQLQPTVIGIPSAQPTTPQPQQMDAWKPPR